MKPARHRNLSQLRTAILLEIAQHPLTLFPLGASFLGAVWTFAFDPSLYSVGAITAGLALSLIGATYNLLFNGPGIRDRILSKWEREADEEENLTKLELRRELLNTPGTNDIVAIHDDLELMYREVTVALGQEGISEVQRAHFLPLVEQNYENATTLFNRLAYLQKRLSNLLDSAAERDAAFQRKIAELRDQRGKMIGHLRQIIAGMERVGVEVPKLADVEIERTARDLEELERSLEIARTAYQKLRDETRPASDVHRAASTGNGHDRAL